MAAGPSPSDPQPQPQPRPAAPATAAPSARVQAPPLPSPGEAPTPVPPAAHPVFPSPPGARPIPAASGPATTASGRRRPVGKLAGTGMKTGLWQAQFGLAPTPEGKPTADASQPVRRTPAAQIQGRIENVRANAHMMGRPIRRLVPWITGLLLLTGWWVWSWSDAKGVAKFATELQDTLGFGLQPAWWFSGIGLLREAAMVVLVLWLVFSRRMFRIRRSWAWIPTIALAVALVEALIRSFVTAGPPDGTLLGMDLVGIAAACLLCWYPHLHRPFVAWVDRE